MPEAPNWRWSRGRWSLGEIWLKPYQHPLLEHGVVTDGRSSLVYVRERARATVGGPDHDHGDSGDHEPAWTDEPGYRARRGQLLGWPLDFVVVECDPDASIRLTAGQWGTAPVYLGLGGGMLHGTWSLPELRTGVDLTALDQVAVTRVLAHRSRYTRHTLFRDVFQLTERATAHYDSRGASLRIEYPDPALHALPRRLRSDADVVDAFGRRLRQAVSRRPYDPRASAVELSGGMDSGNVAMTLGARHRGEILAYALMIGGPAGDQQARRREAMRTVFQFPDLRIPAWEHPPLNPRGRRARGTAVDPLAEPYHEAVEQILTAARAHGVRTVFTGDGGDELLSLRGVEWAALGRIPGRHSPLRNPPPWLGPRAHACLAAIDDDLAPRSVINEATHLGFACRSPQFLTAGLWPVSPLCDPDLIRFGEQLPVEWRRDKRLARERLGRLGFSDEVLHPPLRETFAHLMEAGIRDHGLPLLRGFVDDSLLVDLGYVDGTELRAACVRLADGGPVDTRLFSVLSLELGLRRLLSAGNPREEADVPDASGRHGGPDPHRGHDPR